ncbi:hypothetical protein BH10CYA1_BH10CYA1_26270 [soil metagenome]
MMVEATAMLENYGRIKTMEMPATWQLLEDHNPQSANPSWLKFCPPNMPAVEMFLYFRGRPLTSSAQENLKVILSANSNQLTLKQIESIGELLREAYLIDAFNFLDVRTQDWNGQRVLIVEGRWNQIINDRFWMFIPGNSECETVQEIWFQAPVEQYQAQLKYARQALKSIQWVD